MKYLVVDRHTFHKAPLAEDRYAALQACDDYGEVSDPFKVYGSWVLATRAPDRKRLKKHRVGGVKVRVVLNQRELASHLNYANTIYNSLLLGRAGEGMEVCKKLRFLPGPWKNRQ